MMNSYKIACSIIAVILFNNCATVGPDYAQSDIPDVNYSDVLQKDVANAGPLTPETLAEWWQTLNDPILTELIQQGAERNLDIKEAQARIMEARHQLSISNAGFFPSLDSSANYSKSKSSENTTFSLGERDVYTAGFDANWEIDIFGGIRREVEAAQADLQAQEENLNAIWVSLAGEVAFNYVSLRTLQKRLQVAEDNLRNQSETYEILQSSYNSGLSSELPVQQARYVVEQTRSTIPTFRGGIEGAMNALSVLTGVMPGTLNQRLRESKMIPQSSIEIVTGIPANSLRRRPDIRMAERQLAAQTARIGQAEAQLYPKFYLLGSIGLESLDAGSLFESSSKIWSFGPTITWPIFHANSIRNNIKVQSARQEQSLARYEKSVLLAVKEVRDALVDYAQEQERNQSLANAADAAQMAVEVAQDQYKNGLADFYNVLDAQRSMLTFQDQLAASDGEIIANLVRIYKALGGGWRSL
ncbi:MAG: efflux transporter outer membrane subunit [Candidatus Hinthialibacter antarcticus]|nr:efflux transporter outer membrane subunit [Candidatus Hinthialibacter antarcticus]